MQWYLISEHKEMKNRHSLNETSYGGGLLCLQQNNKQAKHLLKSKNIICRKARLRDNNNLGVDELNKIIIVHPVSKNRLQTFCPQK